MDLSPQSQLELLAIARAALRAKVLKSPIDIPPPIDPQLLQPAGCFVSLHERETHDLRGCIGRLEATGPLWLAAREMAVGVLDDPRFVEQRLTPADLPRMEMELSVLSPLFPATPADDFNPLIHGVHLIVGERSGCFLPQVARETGWSRLQLLERLCTEKLGLPAQSWRDPSAKLMLFSTLIVGPAAV